MKQGIHFDQTYSPVVAWQTIRLFLIIAAVNKWKSIQIDFVMAYTQANINKTAYMELPPGVDFKGMTKETHCLKIVKNLYGGKESLGSSTSKTCLPQNWDMYNPNSTNVCSIKATVYSLSTPTMES